MPISTITVLSLYGELHTLIQAIERTTSALQAMRAEIPGLTTREALLQLTIDLRAAGIAAERAAIEVVMRDAPRVKINPLTGEAG